MLPIAKSILTGLLLVTTFFRLVVRFNRDRVERARARLDHDASSDAGGEPWHFRKPTDAALGGIAVASSPEHSSIVVATADRPFHGEKTLLGAVTVFLGLALWVVGAFAWREVQTDGFRFGDLLGPTVGLVVTLAGLWGILAISEHVIRIDAAPGAITIVTRRGLFFTSRYQYAAASTWTVSGDVQSVFSKYRGQKTPFFILSMKRHVFSTPFNVDLDRTNGLWLVDELNAWKKRVAPESAASA